LNNRLYRRCWWAVLTACLGLLGCGGEIPSDSHESDMVDVPAEVLEASGGGHRTTFVSGKPTVLFLNYGGVVITKGPGSDAAKNLSFIGGGTVPPFSGDQSARDGATALVKQLYKSFNVQIVTKRPSSGDYDMVVIGGSPADLGLSYPSNVAGVAPMDCGDKMPRDICFIFTVNLMKYFSGDKLVKKVAETASHEAAHTYGLPHSDSGCDVMSYKTCSNLKTFLNKTMSMQSDSVGKCGMTAMNSYKLLLAALGPAPPPPPPPPPPPQDTVAPEVTISSPEDGATFSSPSLTVRATISDDKAVTRGELLADGKLVTSRVAPPFNFKVSLDEGQHTLTVRGRDAAGNLGSASVKVWVKHLKLQPPPGGGVTVTSPGVGGGVEANPGFVLDPGSGLAGAPCSSDDDCGGGLCVEGGTCGSAEALILMGGCSAAAGSRTGGLPLLLLLLLLLVLRNVKP